ncbi:MAG TPA: inorganic pyrophosphatase [Pirellulales bacterium]
MTQDVLEKLWPLLGVLFRAHPWHGVSIGPNAPWTVTAYVELAPTDNVKFEVDKTTGLLKVDRPQKYSSVSPTLYGFIPQTYCGWRVAEFAGKHTNRPGIIGDGDPLDVCILSEKQINRSDILLQATPIGGLRMIDGREADDKIIAVMKGDASYGSWLDVSQCPSALVERLRHYFLTYKMMPGELTSDTEVTHVYGQQDAFDVIRRAQEDYREKFGDIEAQVSSVLEDISTNGRPSAKTNGGKPVAEVVKTDAKKPAK